MTYKLLLCEDEPLEREVLGLVVERAQLPLKIVGKARNGFEAVEEASKSTPDIVLMDIKMPGKNGIKAAAEILSKYPSVKLVIITAYDEFEYAKEALQIGAVDYLLKPVRPEKLVVLLRKVIGTLDKEKERRKKESELLESIKKASKLLKAGFLVGLLLGAFEDEKVVEAQAEILGFNQLPRGILVVDPDFDTSCSRSEVDRYEVYRLVEKIVLPDEDAIVQVMGEQIVVGLASLSCGELLHHGEVIRQKVEETLDTTVTVGVGKSGCCETLSALRAWCMNLLENIFVVRGKEHGARELVWRIVGCK